MLYCSQSCYLYNLCEIRSLEDVVAFKQFCTIRQLLSVESVTLLSPAASPFTFNSIFIQTSSYWQIPVSFHTMHTQSIKWMKKLQKMQNELLLTRSITIFFCWPIFFTYYFFNLPRSTRSIVWKYKYHISWHTKALSIYPTG